MQHTHAEPGKRQASRDWRAPVTLRIVRTATWLALLLPGVVAAATLAGRVTFQGTVVKRTNPSCSYSTRTLDIAIPDIAADAIKTTSDFVSGMSSFISPGNTAQTRSAVETRIRNLLPAGSAGYGTGGISVNCAQLGTAMHIEKPLSNTDFYSGCQTAIGCTFLSIYSTELDMRADLGLAMFLYAPTAGTTTQRALWMDLSKPNGTAFGTAFQVFNAADTASAPQTKNIDIGFVLLKRPSASWGDGKNPGRYRYQSAVELNLVYE